MARGSWGTRALACFAALLVCLTSCGKSSRNAGQAQAQPCQDDGDCESGVCLDAGVCQTPPLTENVFVTPIRMVGPDKLDVLLVVDNSIGMADKQAILRDAVPELVRRLVDPPIGVDGQPAFRPVADIHFGVVSSSLGGHGADSCSPNDPQGPNPTRDDKGHLIGTVRQNTVPSFAQERTWNNFGFLAWDASVPPKKSPPGDSNVNDIVQKFADMVLAAGEAGCGFEATLEGWYRFLIDPTPPLDVVNVGNEAVPQNRRLDLPEDQRPSRNRQP